MPLLLTKLFIPRMTDKHISRTGVVKKLIEGYDAGSRLTLVCAPAGYGKTTSVLEFLESVKTDAAWISLDEGDNDPQRFLAYLSEALKKAGVAIGKDVDSLITDIGLQTIETILLLLVNCIAECSGRRILVLDDYHVIRSSKVNDMVKYLLDHQPPDFHLVIMTREDPQLPLARLRMQSKLTEIRMEDLLFSQEETTELFDTSIEIKLSSLAVQRLNARTEGWIAGLQLAALLLRSYREDQVEDFIRKFDGTNRYIIDYLVEDVLCQQAPDIREFLCMTSVLERMNDKLCNELTGRQDSNEVLQRIVRSNLFLVPLDDDREWYRYHHLFADSLKTSLADRERLDLYKKAAAWMKNNGFTYEAVQYAFKSKDLQLAVSMVEDSVLESFQNAQLASLVSWLEQLPDDMIKKSEVLAVRKAIAYFICGRANEAIVYMNSLDKEFEANASLHNKGLLFSLRAMIAALAGQDAEPFAREALRFLQPWDPIARTSAMNSLGRAQYRKGQAAEAMETFKSAYEEGLKIGYQFVTTLALMNYSSCLHTEGQSEDALVLCNQYIEAMEKHLGKLPPFVGILYVTMSELYADKNDMEKARRYREEGEALCRSISYDIAASLKLFSHSKPEMRAPDGSDAGVTSENMNKAGKTIVLEFGERLSEREIEILTLLGKGFSNREIAEALFVTTNTIQWHISNIYGKLGVRSRTQAILKAKEMRIF